MSFTLCKRRKFRVNACKSKVMIFEGGKNEVPDFVMLQRINKFCKLNCKVRIGGNLLEEVRELSVWDQYYANMT